MFTRKLPFFPKSSHGKKKVHHLSVKGFKYKNSVLLKCDLKWTKPHTTSFNRLLFKIKLKTYSNINFAKVIKLKKQITYTVNKVVKVVKLNGS